MQRVERGEVIDLAAYETVRPHFQRRIIQEKKLRRFALGAHMTVVFENHDTVLYQVQEMLRTERITAEPGILYELETYNALVPGADALSATVFVEYADPTQRERMLVELEGLERCFYLAVDAERLPGRSEHRGVVPGRTTALHYVSFELGASHAETVRQGASALAVGVAHPRYVAEAPVEGASFEALRADLVRP